MFTEAELISIRRHCGYPFFGNRPDSYLLLEYFMHYSWMERRIKSLTATEEDVVRTTYLANLDLLESEHLAAKDNLDTDEAAVWKRNPREIKERRQLYRHMRIRLCNFLGVRPGPDVGNGGGSMRLVV